MILPRRKFLAGLAATLAAPAIVRASSLMPVRSVPLASDFSLFGSSSLVFDGYIDEVRISKDPRWDFGSGDFTLEAWIRPNGTGTWKMHREIVQFDAP